MTVEILNLTSGYGDTLALHGVSLRVEKGQVLVLIGPNGSGKTTLIRTASGVLPAWGGRVLADGQDMAHLSNRQKASRLAVVPQASHLPDDFTVFETVMLGRTPYLGWLGQPSHKDLERVQWALRVTDCQAFSRRYIGELSGGEQQRVLLARALAQDTSNLLLDEPTSHLDLHYQVMLLQQVKRLAREHNLSVLMALHDLNMAALCGDRLALLVSGKLKAVGSPVQVLTRENLEAAYQISVKIVPHPEADVPLILPAVPTEWTGLSG